MVTLFGSFIQNLLSTTLVITIKCPVVVKSPGLTLQIIGFGDEIVGTAGCGPTSLAMVAIGLTNNTKYNPRYVAKYAIENGYLDGSKTTWSFMEKGCEAFG